MNIPFVDLGRQNGKVRTYINTAIAEIIDAGEFILGERVAQFEESAAAYIGVPYAVGVASGSDALLLALMAYGIKPGDEVITTPFCFISAVEAIMLLGAKPVFADIEEITYNIDPQKIQEKITHKTKAIIPVHLFGQSATMDQIIELGKKHNIPIIEDVAQAMGAVYKGKKLGSLGDIGCFSFYPTKNLSCLGDGGLITTKEKGIYEKLKALRTHGTQTKKYYHEYIGINSRLDAIQAAVLTVKLPYLDAWNNERKMLGERYNKQLNTQVTIPKNMHGSTYNSYCIRTPVRDQLKEHLEKKEISTSIFYPHALHLQECLNHEGYKRGDFPITEKCTQTILALPTFIGMTAEEQDYVIHTIEEFFKQRTQKGL